MTQPVSDLGKQDTAASAEPIEATPEQSPHIHVGAVFAENLGLSLTIAGLVARLLVPTESAAAGDTLWIVCLQLIGCTIFLLGRWQAGYRFRFDPFLCSVGVLVLGHLVSGGWIYFFNEGNKRLALNLVWEWIAIGAVCCVVRRRIAVAKIVLAMLVVVACHGIWQYYVDFPALREQYSGGTAMGDAQRMADLKARGIPVSEAGLQLFADRLASLEPLGPFALANTLGGFLAVALSFGAVALLSARRSVVSYLTGILLLGPVGYCLLLTKSRTAIVAVGAGALLFVIHRFLNRGKKQQTASRRGAIIAAAVGLVVAVAVIGAVSSGGLDEQVISESPKSLQYRLMYWQGTIATLQESPVFGTGPGNFRQRYTAHKLAASSEEILDPHNLFLDAWCNSGLIGLLGLVLVLIFPIRAALRAHTTESNEATSGRILFTSGLAGFAILFVQQFLTGQERITLLLGQVTVFVVALPLIRSAFGRTEASAVRLASAVAGCVLVVHLLGAGGFTMPAVMQVLLLLIAVGTPAATSPLRTRRWVGLVPAFACCGIAMLSILVTVTTTRTQYLLKLGQVDPSENVLERLANAALQGGLAPDADRLYAGFIFKAVRDQQVPVGVLSEAFPAWSRAKRRDPYAFVDHRSIAMAFAEQYRLTPPELRDPEWRDLAVLHMTRAVKRYPTSPILNAELAILQFEAKHWKEAGQSAKQALELDAINHEYGHKDRYLPIQILSQLNLIEQRKIEKPSADAE